MSLQAKYNSRRAAGVNDPGKMDRRISVYSLTYTQDALGGKTYTLTKISDLWAMRSPAKNTRFFAQEGKHFESMTTYRVRHRSDITTTCRLKAGDDIYEIIGVEEIGRRHFLDLTCRAVDQSVGSELSAADFLAADFAAADFTT